MKILLCSNVYPPHFVGGAELIAHEQAKALIEAGHEVRVFAGDTRSADARYVVSDDRHEGIAVRRVRLVAQDFQPAYANFSHPAVDRHFDSLLKSYRPDVVHFHNLVGLSVTLVRLAKEAGASTVMTLHDHWGFCFKNTAMKTELRPCEDFTACHECQRYVDDGRNRRIPIRMRQDYFGCTLDAVDAYISPSRYLAGSYVAAGFPQTRMHVLRNGIDVDRFAAVGRTPSDRIRFTFIGHFGRHKGVHTLLHALANLPDATKARVNLVGEGEERRECERIVETAGLADCVRLWGRLENSRIVEAYAETDVLVLPSTWRENQPVSITEAMACGRPVIATAMGGNRELVVDGVTGFLFRAGDPVELAERMSRFVDDPALIESMGARGKALMAENSFDAHVRALLQVYEGSRRTAGTSARRAPLFVCVGERVSEVAQKAIALVPRYLASLRIDVTMSEWLTADQLDVAQALVVVDPTIEPDVAIELAATHALPLVVPAANEALTRACRTAQCGLYYADADEAAACLAYLCTHENDRRRLAAAAAAIRGSLSRSVMVQR